MTTNGVDAADLELIRAAQPNLLVCGSDTAIDSVLAALRPSFQQPVRDWAPDMRRALPLMCTGALILKDAMTLDDEQQWSLLDWLDGRAQRVQVIATTGQNLFFFLQHGTFLDRLYYRLNTLHLDLDCPRWGW